jgi:hypothetical protein
MAKQKKTTAKAEEVNNEIWDRMVSNVTNENKEDVLKELELVIRLLSEKGDKDLLPKFQEVLEKISPKETEEVTETTD